MVCLRYLPCRVWDYVRFLMVYNGPLGTYTAISVCLLDLCYLDDEASGARNRRQGRINNYKVVFIVWRHCGQGELGQALICWGQHRVLAILHITLTNASTISMTRVHKYIHIYIYIFMILHVSLSSFIFHVVMFVIFLIDQNVVLFRCCIKIPLLCYWSRSWSNTVDGRCYSLCPYEAAKCSYIFSWF